MEISKGIEIAGLGLWFRESKALAITDLQLGYEEYMNNRGIMVPRVNFREIRKALRKIFAEKGKAEKVIVNGDVKHEFSGITKQEWSEAIELIDFLRENCGEIIFVKGNHDTILKPIADTKKIIVKESFFLEKEKTLFIHGHKKPAEELIATAERVVIGHEHPAIVISDGVKREKYKCFLKGKYRGKELIVMPSFNFVSMGTDVLEENHLSPLLKNIENFECFAVEDRAYAMGKLGELRSL